MLDYKAIGRRISIYRKKKGLTQAVFSEKLDISESYISQIERGATKVSLTRLDKIAEVLKIDIALIKSPFRFKSFCPCQGMMSQKWLR